MSVRGFLLPKYPERELDYVTLREADVLRMRHTKTRREVADYMHLTMSRVVQIEERAINKLRARFDGIYELI